MTGFRDWVNNIKGAFSGKRCVGNLRFTTKFHLVSRSFVFVLTLIYGLQFSVRLQE